MQRAKKTASESKPSPGAGTGNTRGKANRAGTDIEPPRERFRERHRLPDSAAYSRVFGDAARSRDRLFTVLSRRNDSRTARLGLAISKKHLRHSTARNRVKRIVRESFRRHLAMLEGLDVVVLAQSGTAAARNRALFDSLAKHWQNTRSAHSSSSLDNRDPRRP